MQACARERITTWRLLGYVAQLQIYVFTGVFVTLLLPWANLWFSWCFRCFIDHLQVLGSLCVLALLVLTACPLLCCFPWHQSCPKLLLLFVGGRRLIITDSSGHWYPQDITITCKHVLQYLLCGPTASTSIMARLCRTSSNDKQHALRAHLLLRAPLD